MHDNLRTALLQMYPQATAVIDVRTYRPGYLPYPARVTLQTSTDVPVVCTLKASAQPETLTYEVQVIRALAGLPILVPRVLGGPLTIMHDDQPLTVALLSELPGEPLPWFGLNDLATAHRTCQLLLQAVDTLHALTPRVLAHSWAASIHRVTLESELQAILTCGGSWFDVLFFAEAVALLQATIPQFPSPLVFSNGDYNPLNFLVADDALTGWIDFEHACFEDPHVGFAKFVLWGDDDLGWGAGLKAGLVERYVYEHQVPPAMFLVRLLLRGLHHIQETDPSNPPRYMVQVAMDTVSRLTHALS
jgi:aminoglycoside phosphotransferase